MKPTVLLVFAHPDDETFTCGGTIHRYSEQGARVILYSATRGEAGSTGSPPLCCREELGDVRAEELRQAADILGIQRIILKNHGDSRLNQSLLPQLVRDLLEILREEQPDIVITFPPAGLSGHLDHRAVQQAAFQALNRLEAPKPRFYYAAIPASVPTSRPVYTVSDDQVTHQVDVTDHRIPIMNALRAHRTQHQSIERAFPGVLQGHWERLRTVEYFQSVYPSSGITTHPML